MRTATTAFTQSSQGTSLPWSSTVNAAWSMERNGMSKFDNRCPHQLRLESLTSRFMQRICSGRLVAGVSGNVVVLLP
jgi:hypothetical protein